MKKILFYKNVRNNIRNILIVNSMKKIVILMTLAFPMFMLSFVQAQKLSKNNIDEIVKAMTLEEKAQLLVGVRNEMFGGGATIGATQALVPGAAGTTQTIERLGVSRAVFSDGPAGLRINPSRKMH
jgi:beta-glucosidase